MAYYALSRCPIYQFTKSTSAARYLAYPERLSPRVKGAQSQCIIIDEIQKAPDLLSVVHGLIEEKQGWQFILTGSSSRKLKRSGVDLLAGRALVRHLYPFMAQLSRMKNFIILMWEFITHCARWVFWIAPAK